MVRTKYLIPKHKYRKSYVDNKGAVFIMCMVALCSLFSACGYKGDDSYGGFAHDLQGTWVTNMPEEYDYSGTIVIGSNTVTITGYEVDYWYTDDPQRPFIGINRGVARKGYSQNGVIYIDDFGIKEFPYEYDPGVYPTYTELLRFTFSGRNETLIKTH
jgi:hypothetical protein